MPYTPVTFVDGVTPLNAANMNKLEDGVEATTAVADAAVPKALVDAKGDLLAATAADTVTRLPVGTNGQALLADSAQASGLKWGVAGAALTYEGDHAPATTYDDGDVVVKDGIAYLCVGGPTTVTPDPAPWGAAELASSVWQDYTPILTATVTNPTLGTGAVSTARYCRVGKQITYQGLIKFGTGLNPGSGGYRVSIPVPVRASPFHVMGQGWANNAAQTLVATMVTLLYQGLAPMSFNWVPLDTVGSAGSWGGMNHGTPFAWAAGDEIHWGIVYEAA